MGRNNSVDEAADLNRIKAWSLRVQGKTYREIGKELNVSHVTAWKYVEVYLAEQKAQILEEAEHHKSAQLERIDKVIAVLMPLVEQGDFEAMDRLDKFEKRRAALLGLDAPAKQELTGKDGESLDMGAASAAERIMGALARLATRGSEDPVPGKPGA